MMADGPIFNPSVDLGAQLDDMVSSGVESLRVVFDWAEAQPYQTWDQVPASMQSSFSQTSSGIPTDFGPTDQIVRLAAERDLPLLPVVIYAPTWDAVTTGSQAQPVQDGPYGQYLTTLVQRYGPEGSFWTENPDLTPDPIRQWQIWNEPDLVYFWSTFPFQRSYVELLRVAHAAIKQADPGARVVLAGLPNRSWQEVQAIYRIRGSRSLFDAAAVHPYTGQPQGVIRIIDLFRRTMTRNGDRRKPILVTEFGWPSSLGQTPKTFGVATTQAGQAEKLKRLIPMLAADRRRLGLGGFYLYTWMGDEHRDSATFQFSGLFGFNPSNNSVFVKPAYAVFRREALALEACRQKASVATECLKRG